MQSKSVVLLAFFALTYSTNSFSAITGPYFLPINNTENSRVKIYLHDPNAKDENHVVIFKYGDMIKRAIRAVDEGGATNIEIKFAIYKFHNDVYIGHNHEEPSSYGEVGEYDFDDDNTSKLSYLLCKAASKNEIDVKVVFHETGDTGTDDNVGEYFNSRTICNNLEYQQITWGTSHRQQMHNKFMLVSTYQGDNPVTSYTDNVYVATANVDKFNGLTPTTVDYVQSGVLVNGNTGLYNAYSNYFKKIWETHYNHDEFKAAVRTAHINNTLNYNSDGSTDESISAYFYPIPMEDGKCGTNNSGWDESFNAMSKYVEKLVDNPDDNKYLKINMYHLKNDDYGKKLINVIKGIDPKTGIRAAWKKDSAGGTDEAYNALASNDENGLIDNNFAPRKTHAKNYTFAFPSDHEYYSITGSTNSKQDAYCDKANNQLVIQEVSGETIHPVYSDFVTIFNKAKSAR